MDDKYATALIEEIYDAFRTVTRQGGVSWSEAYAIDMHCSEVEQAKARLVDPDRSWTELVDSDWQESPGVGGFVFLDPIGFRYYLAASLVRGIKRKGSLIDNVLMLKGGGRKGLCQRWSLFDERQLNCVKSFVTYMVEVTDEQWVFVWEEVRSSGWEEI
jgi:hypothetical protein